MKHDKTLSAAAAANKEAMLDDEVLEPSWPDPITTAWKDAALSGEHTPEWDALLQRPMTLLLPKDKRRNAKQTQWKNATATTGAWLYGDGGLTSCPVKNKKGYYPFVPGAGAGGSDFAARTKNGMVTLEFLALDVDSGDNLNDIGDKIEARGIAALIYASYNDQTTTSDIPRDRVLTFIKAERDPTDEEVRAYLRQQGKHREHHIESAKIVKQRAHTTEGMMIRLEHAPLEKFRILFPLAEPIRITDLAPTQRKAHDRWKRLLLGYADHLCLLVDHSCVDVSRAYYVPSRRPKVESCIDVIRGRPLTLAEIEEHELPEQKQEAKDGPGSWLKGWAKGHANRIRMADLIRENAPEMVVREVDSDKIEVVCPNKHLHSDEGDGSAWVTNADGDGRGFEWGCHRNGCKTNGMDRLDHLARAIEDGRFDEDLIEDEAYLWPDDEEEDSNVVEDAESDALLEDLLTQARTFDTTTRDRQIDTLLEEAFKQRDVIGDTGRRDLLETLKKTTKLGVRDLATKWKSVAEAYAAKVVAQDARQRAKRETPDLVSLEEATPESVAEAAAASKWLPTGFTVKEGWFCQMTEDKAKKVCREFEVLYCADGKKGSTRTNEVTIRYQHRSAALGVVDSTFRKGDTYKDSGTILGRLSNEGLEFAPNASTEAILTLLRAVSSDREAVYVERSGWLGGREVFVSPTGAVVKKEDDARVYVLDHTMKVANGKAGTLDDAIKAAGDALNGQNAKRFLPGFLGGAVGCLADFLDEELAVIVANEGEAKRGKTTALKAGISWFAAPDADGLLITGDMTPTAMEGKAVQASGAMFAPDEQGTSKMTAQDEQAAILQYAGKIGRARGKQDGSLRDIATWHGCMGMSTERGLLARLEAEQAKDSEVTIRSGAVSRVFTVSYDDAVKLDREQDKDELAAYDVLAHGGAYGWLGPVFAKALIELGVDAVQARVSALEKEWGAGRSGAAERVVTTAALFGVAAEVAQGAGLLPSDIDLKAMLAELLDETIAQRSHHLDTERQALDTLRRNIIRMRNQQRIVAVGNEDGVRADVVGYWSAPGKAPFTLKERTYILPVDRLGSLSNTEPAALVEKLRREGGVVEPSKGTKHHAKGFWEGTPGEGSKIKSLRVSGEWVHGDDEDPVEGE